MIIWVGVGAVVGFVLGWLADGAVKRVTRTTRTPGPRYPMRHLITAVYDGPQPRGRG